ncbi:hypothetical protein TUM4445_27830 [Shewanella sp. MBTL60-112-B2]|nr:hypothetical protein TUM4444_31450 [Shewanella sp. MBTL60-112-B1]GIU36572.1 hypothetical protein TUM4445_27830 [Shewanella sp. MBTL60-112-B2]
MTVVKYSGSKARSIIINYAVWVFGNKTRRGFYSDRIGMKVIQLVKVVTRLADFIYA